MTYSSGVFERDRDTLEQAQRNKYLRLLGMLGAEPGQHVLEIGCGWGGFARQAATAGLRVTGLTLSKEQLAWAGQSIKGTPLESRIELRLQDYRDVTGRFDHIVSIEMFEAVGEAYWPTYMQTLARCLAPGGRAALQVITIDPSMFDDYKAHPDFIQHYIFPGGMLPTVERFDAAAAGAGLAVVERTFHAADYARTLAAWRETFEQQLDAVRALGYDERFIRMWRYYLSYCEAGFIDERIDVMQVALAHQGDGDGGG
jgi:cyclopropane-fatty-acyl-phospholipid synthase